MTNTTKTGQFGATWKAAQGAHFGFWRVRVPQDAFFRAEALRAQRKTNKG
jgi:hypothetical protein